ncbi:MAG: Crp/Fnr family transcriptional regulator [Haliscomenobacter sp.]|nr:Crp/Fnr family transcriptional regulator [Haliscomenobacter sp.]MBK9489827.1 Crp/Fnr family transcriptional regulator [Haliscomenobacter sp.]
MTTTRDTSVVAFLRQIPFLEQLPYADLHELALLCQSEQIQRNSAIYSKGDISNHLFVLLRGSVKVCSFSEDGREIIKEMLSPIALFGDLGLVGEKERQENAFSMQDEVQLLRIPIDAFRKLIRRHPNLSMDIVDWLGTRLRRAEARLEALMFKDARERIIDFLKDSAENQGKKIGFELLIKHSMTQQDIANYTGTSRQTVTSVLNELRKSNLIYFNRRSILIRDLERLV